MAIRTLPREDWAAYFDDFSKVKSDTGRIDMAEIRVLSKSVGVQPLTDWMPLQGLVYDPKDDLLEVQVPGLDHLVGKPRTIYVDEEAGQLERFVVVRNDGTQEIIELR